MTPPEGTCKMCGEKPIEKNEIYCSSCLDYLAEESEAALRNSTEYNARPNYTGVKI